MISLGLNFNDQEYFSKHSFNFELDIEGKPLVYGNMASRIITADEEISFLPTELNEAKYERSFSDANHSE